LGLAAAVKVTLHHWTSMLLMLSVVGAS